MSMTATPAPVTLRVRRCRRLTGPAWITMVSALALCPPSAWAQASTTVWQEMHPTRLATLYVVDHRGRETTGQFLELDATSIVILVDGHEQRFEASEVTRVSARGDRVRNGVWKGALVGVGLGLLADCYKDDRPCSTRRRVSLMALAVGVWSGIGAGVDALHTGRTVLYEVQTRAQTR